MSGGGGQYSGEATSGTSAAGAAADAAMDGVFSEEEYDDSNDAALLDSLAADLADFADDDDDYDNDNNDGYGHAHYEGDGSGTGTPEMPPLPGAQQQIQVGLQHPAPPPQPIVQAPNGVPNGGTGTAPPYVTTGQINRHDVLCGRGQGINDNPGNLHFRSVVAGRKAEYVQAPTNKKKSQIAREVIHRIRFEVSPPGRFLKRATPDDVRRLGIDEGTVARAAAEDAAHHGGGGGDAGAAGGGGACGIWIPVTEAVMMERAKMSLRRQEGGDRKDRQPQPQIQQQMPPAMMGSNGDALHRNQNRNFGHSSDSSLNAAQLLVNTSNSSSAGTGTRGASLGSSVPQYGASSASRAGADHSHSSMHTSGSSLSNFDANILALVSGASAGGRGGRGGGNLATATAAASAAASADAAATTAPAEDSSPNVNASAVTSEAILSSLLQRQQQQRSGTPMTSLADATSTLRVRQTSHTSYGADSPAPTFASGSSSPSVYGHVRSPRSGGGSMSDADGGVSDDPGADSSWEPIPVINNANAPVGEESGAACTLREWRRRELSQNNSDAHQATGNMMFLMRAVSLGLDAIKVLETCHRRQQTLGGADAIGMDSILVAERGDDQQVATGRDCFDVEIVSDISNRGISTSSEDLATDAAADLAALGVVLYEVFSGLPPQRAEASPSSERDEDGMPTTKRRGRTHERSDPSLPFVPLKNLGFPLSVDFFVSNLLQSKYSSAEEAATNVALILDTPDQFLYGTSQSQRKNGSSHPTQSPSKVMFAPGKIYGRDREVANLFSIYERAMKKTSESNTTNAGSREISSECVMIAGISGTGKTTLALELQQLHEESGGYFIRGAFDAMRQTQPLSAIVSALDSYCQEVVKRMDASQVISLRTALHGIVGEHAGVFTTLIPNLSDVLGIGASYQDEMHDDVAEVGKDALNRLIFFFRRFFHIIANSHNVVLLLDDLQRADNMSLDLIKALVLDPDIPSFLFIGNYRTGEVECTHPLYQFLQDISSSPSIRVNEINLSNMDPLVVNGILADVLELPPWMTQKLSSLVFKKTSGNIMFLREFLSSLCDQNLLRYSASKRRWVWDEAGIESLEISDSVVDLMRGKMLRLDDAAQWSLKIAASFGARCDVRLFDLLSRGLGGGPEDTLVEPLSTSEAIGLVIKDGPTYKFCHDQIQQAAYSLIPEEARSSLHLLIARSLHKAASAEEMETSLFVIVDQFNRGAIGIVDADEKLQVATLNLRAAKKAIASSTFLAASIYLKLAICFLQEEDWQSNYNLSLEVYSSCAEVEYVAGTFEDMSLALNEVLEHGRCLDDKLRAFYTLARAFAAQNDLKNAMKTGFDILAELGHPLENTSDKAATTTMVLDTKAAIESKDQVFWSSLPRMSDARKKYTMKFLCLMAPYAFLGGGERLPFIGCRMVQLTMADGLDFNSPYGFAILAVVFCGFMRNPKEGYRIGKIGKMLLGAFNSKDTSYLARTHAVLYGFVNVWTEPLQASLPQLMIGHDNGLSSGDTECAARCATLYINNAFQSGLNLHTLLAQMNTFASEMRQYKQFMPLRLLTLFIQSVLNLTNANTNDPVLLTGEAMDEQSFLEEVTSKGIKLLLCQFYFRKMKHAYLFQRHDVAAEAIMKGREIKSASLLLPKFEGCTYVYLEGLTALYLAARSNDDADGDRWCFIADEAIEKMESWAEESSWNCRHKLEHLQAEKCAIEGSIDKASSHFAKALESAKKHRFAHEEALIAERYGAFLLQRGDDAAARERIEQARDNYSRWGAMRKVADIEQLLRTS